MRIFQPFNFGIFSATKHMVKKATREVPIKRFTMSMNEFIATYNRWWNLHDVVSMKKTYLSESIEN